MASYNPKTYDDRVDPVEFVNWIKGMDKVFYAIKCPEKWKIGFVVYYLVGQADLWWETMKENKDEVEFGWSQFKKLMRSKFYPPSLRRQKEEEFKNLEQGYNYVMVYAGKFMKLLRFPCIW
ncbi:hypothetical protein vseg_018139 [Gypsophila vaccaria]